MRRHLALVAAGVGLGALVLAIVLWPAAGTGPEPVAWGRDACAECRMLLSQPGFAAEMRDRRGTLTKYDDIGCLLGALAKSGETGDVWVEDHGGSGFVRLGAAHLVRAPGVVTPMGHGVVAFREEAAARGFAAARGGSLIALDDLLQDPVALTQARSWRTEGKGTE